MFMNAQIPKRTPSPSVMMPSPSVPAFETVPKMLVALAHGSNEPMVIAPAPASLTLRAVESAVDTGAGGGGGGGIGPGPGACSGGSHLPSLPTPPPLPAQCPSGALGGVTV